MSKVCTPLHQYTEKKEALHHEHFNEFLIVKFSSSSNSWSKSDVYLVYKLMIRITHALSWHTFTCTCLFTEELTHLFQQGPQNTFIFILNFFQCFTSLQCKFKTYKKVPIIFIIILLLWKVFTLFCHVINFIWHFKMIKTMVLYYKEKREW